MKMSAFRSLIREEIKRVLTEGNDKKIKSLENKAEKYLRVLSDKYGTDDGVHEEFDTPDGRKQFVVELPKVLTYLITKLKLTPDDIEVIDSYGDQDGFEFAFANDKTAPKDRLSHKQHHFKMSHRYTRI